jgi:hypothetical protein
MSSGRHVPDRLCFQGNVIRLVTGASWVDIEAILDHQVSDTTLRARRDEWIDADGSLHQAPTAGRAPAPNPTDRAKLGWKWSVAAERHGIPIGWAIDGANHNDVALLEPTLDAVDQTGLLAETGVLHLDRSYDSGAMRDRLHAAGLDQFEIQRRGTRVPGVKRQPLRLGRRWTSKPPTPGGPTTATSPQHRPASPPPPRRSVPRHQSPHRRPPHRLAQPLELHVSAYPLKSLAGQGRLSQSPTTGVSGVCLARPTAAVVPVNEFVRYQRAPPRSPAGVQVPLPFQSPTNPRSPARPKVVWSSEGPLPVQLRNQKVVPRWTAGVKTRSPFQSPAR